jgi:hypothetical protein
MKFEFWTSRGATHIRAQFDDDDNLIGRRQESPGTEIKYLGEDILFDYEVKQIHPDILGLICLLIFYPFIGKRVEFPIAVSPRLKEAFSNPNFKRQFEFVNIDPSVPIYHGSKMALSFGGGIDSSSVRVMFPEVFVVHEGHIKNGFWNRMISNFISQNEPKGDLVPSHVHDVVKSLGSDNARLVVTNQRYVSQPVGWHCWPCATITTLLLATDMNFGIIFTGTNIGSSMLSNGDVFYDRLYARKFHGPSGNFWQSTFEAIGIPLFSPIIGTSGFQAMALSRDLVKSNEVVSCMRRDGNACKCCPKCLRRDLIRTVVDSKYIPDWKAYDTKTIHLALSERPLCFGHVHSYAAPKIDNLPLFISERLDNLPQILTDWPMKFYEEAFELCPEEWRKVIRDRVLTFIEPMNSEEIKELKDWSQITGEI